MSNVSNVIMVTLPDDTGSWREMSPLDRLVQVDQLAGGPKCMECDVFMAAYNYLDRDEIIRVFKSVEWECPEEAQLMVKGQDDEQFTIYSANK